MKFENVFILGLVLLLIILILVFLNRGNGMKEVKTITIMNSQAEEIRIDVEIAKNMLEKMRGLMGRKTLGEKEGMIFVFDKEEVHGFWMMNTTIHLEALHFDSFGKLVDIVDMEPCRSLFDCPTYKAKGTSKYVLEVSQGFSQKHNIEIGKSEIKMDEFRGYLNE